MIHRLDERDLGALVALVEAGRFGEAEARALSLIAQHPNIGMLWKVLSVAQLRQQKDALAALQRAPELMPGDAEVHANLGSALHRAGRWAEALASLRRALRLKPDDVGALVEAGDCLKELGQPADAITVYQQALRLEPHQPDALNNLGNALMQIGQHPEALSAYRLALELKPDAALIHCNLANARQAGGQLEDALASSRRALELDASFVPAHNRLGLVLVALGRREEAIVSFRAALALEAENLDARQNLDTLLGGSAAETAAPQGAIQRMRALMERGQFAAALASAESLAHGPEESREFLLAIAICQRMLSRFTDALATLDRLQRDHPDFSRQYQERGICQALRSDTTAALEAFLRAVELNPALAASWTSLETLYQRGGEDGKAQQAGAQLAALKALPPEALTAMSLYYDGDLVQAERLLRALLGQRGENPEVLLLLGRIALQRAAAADALQLLRRAVAIAPEHRPARYELARALLMGNRPHRARTEFEALLALDPSNLAYRMLYARACGAAGDHLEAIRVYRELIGSGASEPGLRQWLGNALKALGRMEEAVDAYREAVAMRPDFGIAYWSLADLKTYRFSDQETAQMRAVVDAPSTSVVDRYHLYFALGKALEERGEYGASFEYYSRGNALKRSRNTYQPDPERISARQIETCSSEFFASRRGVGCPSADPIFIVGLPRSGSTLLEQILASHSLVEGTMELTVLPALVSELHGRSAEGTRYPGMLADLSPADFLRLGRSYLDETRLYRADRPYFIDKLSGNFRHIGLIHLMLPNAKIIDARREPMACCFSNFKQLFASGQEFTYSMDDLARYYRSYLDLMRHWDRVLPGKVLRVQHEDVVADLEESVRRMLGFCGLEFEPGCVQYHQNTRSVRTASAQQVRQPINRDSLDQWRHFAPWLGTLQSALGDALTGYR